ncbi:Carbohydrate binding domain-containing protein [Andreprevotia lacus DSM 23236]|jgi:chitodextrinase|uniref:Carbohydrate binding domain-containing protein n=1 Tax=Andreprevotia lacus DSM 23236 TaxID=1121001 RepID=A0A1W1XWB2_9NEIS|nr:carbohydrate-binding protein [Andreprevotia lacus]SMC28223.1 Carbohydrate binding domain-containing protein [Andreprevotia lacus DSM 23236]
MRALHAVSTLAVIPLQLMLIGQVLAADPTPTPAPAAKVLHWSGFDWSVRAGGGGPGPNNWDDRNAWVDAQGYLHLKIANRDGVWSSTEIQLGTNMDRLGFGTFQTHMIGRPDQLDPNVVFGFYTYPPRDVGADATNEIDIEFSKWGNQFAPIGNYTVWPAVNAANRSWSGFDLALDGDKSTHRFNWQSDKVTFQSLNGHVGVNDNTGLAASWVFDPKFPPAVTDNRLIQWYCSSHDPLQCISQKPQYFLINLWQVGGRAPSDNKEVEIILTDFTYVPAGATPTPQPTTPPTPTPVGNVTPTPTVVPTPAPSTVPTVAPTIAPQPTATPVPASGCYAAWNNDSVYLTGQRITRNGRNYEAKWWTQGNDPTVSGQWGPWADLGPCTGNATPTATPKPTATPTVTPKPTATPTAAPTATPQPTSAPQPTPAPGCPAWQEGVPYAVGNCVSYQGKQYTALIAHTAPIGGGWTPPAVPTLWQAK